MERMPFNLDKNKNYNLYLSQYLLLYKHYQVACNFSIPIST